VQEIYLAAFKGIR